MSEGIRINYQAKYNDQTGIVLTFNDNYIFWRALEKTSDLQYYVPIIKFAPNMVISPEHLYAKGMNFELVAKDAMISSLSNIIDNLQEVLKELKEDHDGTKD